MLRLIADHYGTYDSAFAAKAAKTYDWIVTNLAGEWNYGDFTASNARTTYPSDGSSYRPVTLGNYLRVLFGGKLRAGRLYENAGNGLRKPWPLPRSRSQVDVPADARADDHGHDRSAAFEQRETTATTWDLVGTTPPLARSKRWDDPGVLQLATSQTDGANWDDDEAQDLTLHTAETEPTDTEENRTLTVASPGERHQPVQPECGRTEVQAARFPARAAAAAAQAGRDRRARRPCRTECSARRRVEEPDPRRVARECGQLASLRLHRHGWRRRPVDRRAQLPALAGGCALVGVRRFDDPGRRPLLHVEQPVGRRPQHRDRRCGAAVRHDRGAVHGGAQLVGPAVLLLGHSGRRERVLDGDDPTDPELHDAGRRHAQDRAAGCRRPGRAAVDQRRAAEQRDVAGAADALGSAGRRLGCAPHVRDHRVDEHHEGDGVQRRLDDEHRHPDAGRRKRHPGVVDGHGPDPGAEWVRPLELGRHRRVLAFEHRAHRRVRRSDLAREYRQRRLRAQCDEPADGLR